MRRHGRARRKTFECTHRGFGEECHRCALATVLDRAAKGIGEKPALALNARWTVQQMADEALRLRLGGRATTGNWQPESPSKG